MNEIREIVPLLDALSEAGLLAVRDAIDARLDELVDRDEGEDLGGNGRLVSHHRDPKSRARGWVELKVINGCGPYAYMRWNEGGRKRSKYIGKVKG